MRRLRSIAVLSGLCTLVLSAVLMAGGGGPAAVGDAAAQARSTLSQLLAQGRRNAKVSERLNAAFFRAPQTRQYVGSTFQPTDSDTAYTVDRGDSGLSLDIERPGTQVQTTGAGADAVSRLVPVPQTTGTFELPLDVPNRAEVVSVRASYRDAAGANTRTGDVQAPSGFAFSLVRLGQLSESPEEQLASGPVRSLDGRTGTFALPLRNNGFRVDNSSYRYVMRVRIDDVSPETRFHGFTVQYVIGRGVPGAPAPTTQG